MNRTWSLRSFVIFFLCISLQKAVGIELQPIRPDIGNGYGQRFAKRTDDSALNLRSIETFFWGGMGSSDAMLANFTVYMPGDVENILSMEKFYPLLKSVNCTRDKITLAFKDDKTFAYAQKVWDWVNGADDHAFVMVAGLGDCGWNRHRQPFIVTSIAYDEGLNTARLTAKPSDWKTVAHTYDLTVGHVPLTDSRLPARDFSKNLALEIATLFPFSVKITENGLSSALECSNCGTTGKIDFELKISTEFAVPTGASIIISPKGVSAKAELKLTESGELTESLPFEKEVLKLPLDSITIPGGIVNIGPNLVVSVGFEISSWEGAASISGGAIVTLPDSAILQLDLLNPSNNKFSGWTPHISPIPISVDAKISAGLEIYAKPALKLVAEAINHGYEIGLDLKMPFLNAKFEATVSKTGACDTKHEFGVQVSSNIGAKLTVEAAKVSSPTKPFLNLEIATLDFPLAEHCFAFGPLVDGGDSTKPPPGGGSTPPPPSDGGPPPSDSGSGATSCKTKSGLSGTCISTSACSSGGGESEAGHCPGAANIQCCTHPPKDEGTGGSCKIKSGLSGTCISTSACSSSGGKSEAGHCPGAENIQCCTHPPKDESTGGSCKIKSGLKGTCISTSTCSTSGGESEAGHCPGAANIQCCTYGSCTVGAKNGLCKATSSCEGKSTPGHCPGATDIQCCTTS